jgi:hypothetical protein
MIEPSNKVPERRNLESRVRYDDLVTPAVEDFGKDKLSAPGVMNNFLLRFGQPFGNNPNRRRE